MRTPSVYVRDLSPGEGRLLKSKSRTAKHFATRQRAQILLASAAARWPPPTSLGPCPRTRAMFAR